jgi:hypothetical protein
MKTEKTKRPTLSDPAEFALIRSIYCIKDSFKEKLDPIEDLERSESRHKNLKNNAR